MAKDKMTRTSTDNWLLQKDIIAEWFSSATWLRFRENAACVRVHEADESYVHSLDCISECVSPNGIRARLNKPYQDEPMKLPIKLLLHGRGAFLGRAFQNFHRIVKSGDAYVPRTPGEWTTVAVRVKRQGTLKSHCHVGIRAEFLADFLDARGFVLLFKITCHRWSERELVEFDLAPSENLVNEPGYRYRMNLRPWSATPSRERMRSVSMLEGERLVTSDDIRSQFGRKQYHDR